MIVEKEPAEVTAAEVFAFSQHDYYSKQLESSFYKKWRWAGFNPSALLFGSNWFFYRKLHLFGLLYLLSSCVIFIGTSFIKEDTNYIYDFDAHIRNIRLAGLLGNRILFSIIANNLYFIKAFRVIKSESLQNYTNQEYLAVLKLRGGVSYAVPIVISLLGGLFLLFLRS